MPVVTTPGSSSISCHSGSGWLDIWRAKPVFVLQPIAEQDTFSRQTYRVSPRQYAGYEVGTHAQPHSDVQWDCHTPYQDIGAGDSQLWALGRWTTVACKVAFKSLVSWTLAPATTTLKGPPASSTRMLRLVPALPRSVGFRPIRSPPNEP